MLHDRYIVLEGIHKDPNNIETLDRSTQKTYGPLNKSKADELAQKLIQKNVDNFYHRAWVVKEIDNKESICEECNVEDASVKQNLIMYGFKTCKSCYISKTIFPV